MSIPDELDARFAVRSWSHGCHQASLRTVPHESFLCSKRRRGDHQLYCSRGRRRRDRRARLRSLRVPDWPGVWCTLQTVTTVGYGDVTPAEPVGRVVASIVMLTSIGLITVITAAVTSTFVAAAARRDARLTRTHPTGHGVALARQISPAMKRSAGSTTWCSVSTASSGRLVCRPIRQRARPPNR